jgi:hypothetical protein
VYKARLRSTGEEVAVKVQRPGIGENIAIDMVLLRRLVSVVDKNIPQVWVGSMLCCACCAVQAKHASLGIGARCQRPAGGGTVHAVISSPFRPFPPSARAYPHTHPLTHARTPTAALPGLSTYPSHSCTRPPQVSQPLVPLVDEFAARLFGELDYVQEGRNAEKFAELYRWGASWQATVHGGVCCCFVYGRVKLCVHGDSWGGAVEARTKVCCAKRTADRP